MMTRLIAPVLVVAALALATESARAQVAAPATAPAPAVRAPAPAAAGTYYYSNGYYYYRPATPIYTYPTQPSYPGRGTRYGTQPGYYSHNGVHRGPSGAMSGRVRQDFDPTGRPVQLHKPWLQPIR